MAVAVERIGCAYPIWSTPDSTTSWMSERFASGRPWTELEDQLLTQAINIHGENDNWKLVALSVPGRTNKACRKVRLSYPRVILTHFCG